MTRISNYLPCRLDFPLSYFRRESISTLNVAAIEVRYLPDGQ